MPCRLGRVAGITGVAFALVAPAIPGDFWPCRTAFSELERLGGYAADEREKGDKTPDDPHGE